MARITIPHTYQDNENVLYTILNQMFTTIYQAFNGGIDDSNIDDEAAIKESKILMDITNGHDHDGVNSKLISKMSGWGISGVLFVDATYLYAPIFIVPNAKTVKEVTCYVNTAPTGANLIIDVEKSTDSGANWTSLWNTNTENKPTILAGTKTISVTTFDLSNLEKDDLLRVKILQVGSTLPGEDLTVEVI